MLARKKLFGVNLDSVATFVNMVQDIGKVLLKQRAGSAITDSMERIYLLAILPRGKILLFCMLSFFSLKKVGASREEKKVAQILVRDIVSHNF